MNRYADTINLISARLDELTQYDDCSYSQLLEAERYSLLAGGKHLRGLLLIKTAMLGGVSVERALDFACALEIVHTYSLVHDDLPEMDNDDLRRGKPTCHKKFGADIALLAGDALLTKAFALIASNRYFSDTIKIRCISILSEACGEHGMLAGQMIDKKSENSKIGYSDLCELQQRKTGDMFKAAIKIGCCLSEIKLQYEVALLEYIDNLGIAFQIKDDILDVESTAEELGKPINSDRKCNKSTFVSIFGLEQSKQILKEKIINAKTAVKQLDDSFFILLADYFADREK